MPGDRMELNARLAATLSSPVLMALDMHRGQTPRDLANSANIARNMIQEEGAEVLGLIVNQVLFLLYFSSCAPMLSDLGLPIRCAPCSLLSEDRTPPGRDLQVAPP